METQKSIYAAAKKAWGTNGFGEIRLPYTKDVAFINEHTGEWEHQFADGSDMSGEQWRYRALSQLGW